MTVVDPRKEREYQRQLARERALLNDPARREAMAAELTADDEDRLLQLAAELVIVSGNGSWKMLHRKMRIGQGHAQRLLRILEMRGVVDPEVDGQCRVRVERADLDATLARLCADPGEKVADGGGAGGEPSGAAAPPEADDGGEPAATSPVDDGGDDTGGGGGGHAATTPAHIPEVGVHTVIEFISWVALIGGWVLSGFLCVELYQNVPGGVQGAVATNAVIGVMLAILIRRWGR